MSGPYRTAQDDPGCYGCGHGTTWHVVGPDETASSTSYGDEEEAHALTHALNAAYELGQRNPKPVMWIKFALESMPSTGRVYVWDAEFGSVSTMYIYGTAAEILERTNSARYTHWLAESALPAPIIEPAPVIETQPVEAATVELPVEPPHTPEPQPSEREPAWDDDIPFAWVAVIPFAGWMAHATQTLFQV